MPLYYLQLHLLEFCFLHILFALVMVVTINKCVGEFRNSVGGIKKDCTQQHLFLAIIYYVISGKGIYHPVPFQSPPNGYVSQDHAGNKSVVFVYYEIVSKDYGPYWSIGGSWKLVRSFVI